MTDTTIHETQHTGDTAGHDAHPSDAHYIKIAIFLAVLTALETATYYIPAFEENTSLLLVALIPMMVVKFGTVAWYFMHLKSDSRLFTRLFLGAIALAVSLYLVVLIVFQALF